VQSAFGQAARIATLELDKIAPNVRLKELLVDEEEN
jgi:hypothetical protein